ncbi:MAG TPA: DUF1553 domain-containing protein, partial [Planctomycetota bacterium]|nr:DUF1553 domain-containing protein [Planctomycetota bacterium]
RYQQDRGESLYRRSLYTFWRRSVGPTMIFDASTRQTCAVRQTRTNTPLHALVLLNDVTYVEAARGLAQRMLRRDESAGARLRWAFRAATARPPLPGELEVLLQGLERTLSRYREDPGAAGQLISVGESPRDQSLDPVELAAYTATASVLLNLDETISKE